MNDNINCESSCNTSLEKSPGEIWDEYCDLFDVCISRDEYSLEDEDFYEITLRSIVDKTDYLARFNVDDEAFDKSQLLYDIVGDDDEAVATLSAIYESLALNKLNLDKQFMVLNMLYNCKIATEELGKSENLLNEINLDINELIDSSQEYRWWPEAIIELRQLRTSVLDMAWAVYENEQVLSGEIEDYEKKISLLYDVIQVTNYKYASRKLVKGEFNFLKSEIEKDCTYIVQRNADVVYSAGLSDKIMGISGFDSASFSLDSGFKEMKFNPHNE